MSKNYVDACIEEALIKSTGNRTKACQMLLARCADDPLLEDGLFANFRESITMAHVQRVAHRMENKGAANESAQGIDGSAFANMVSHLEKTIGGQDPLSANSLKPAPGQPVNKAAQSPGHGNNLRAIADAFKKPFGKKSSPSS